VDSRYSFDRSGLRGYDLSETSTVNRLKTVQLRPPIRLTPLEIGGSARETGGCMNR